MGLIFQNTEQNKIGDGLIIVPDGSKDSTAIVYNDGDGASNGSFSFISDECDLCKNITFSIWGKLCKPYSTIISSTGAIDINIDSTYSYTIGVKFSSYSEEEGFTPKVLGMFGAKLTNSWQRFNKTINLSEEYSGKIRISLMFRSDFPTTFSALLYKSQLEVGDIATGWRASPTDVLQEAIASATTSVESNLFDYQDGLRSVYFFASADPYESTTSGSSTTENINANLWNKTVNDYWYNINTKKIYEKIKLEYKINESFSDTYREINDDNLKNILSLIPKKSYYKDAAVKTYVQGNDPTSNDIDTGDLWIKTSNNEYGLYIYSKGNGEWNPIGINYRLLNLTDFNDGKTTVYGLGFTDNTHTSSTIETFAPNGLAIGDYCLERIYSSGNYTYSLYKRTSSSAWSTITNLDISSILKLYSQADTSDDKVVWVYAPCDGNNTAPDLTDVTYQNGDCWINKANNEFYTYNSSYKKWIPLDSYLIDSRPIKTIILYSEDSSGSDYMFSPPSNANVYYTCTVSLYDISNSAYSTVMLYNDIYYKADFGNWTKITNGDATLKNHYKWDDTTGATITTGEDESTASSINLGNGAITIKTGTESYSKFSSTYAQFGNYRLESDTSFTLTNKSQKPYTNSIGETAPGLMFKFYAEE